MSSFWKKLFPGKVGGGGAYLFDVLVYIITFQGLVLIFPYVYNQFNGLTSAMDMLWYTALDITVLCFFLMFMFFLQLLLRRFYHWATRSES